MLTSAAQELGRPRSAATGGRRFTRADPSSAASARLPEVLELVATLPAASIARERALEILDRGFVDLAALVLVLESDPALALAVVRGTRSSEEAPASVADALRRWSAARVREAVAAVDTYAVGSSGRWIRDIEAHRHHAVATCRIADRLTVAVGGADREEVALVALLHDIGKLPMLSLYPRYREIARMPATTDQLVALERRSYGVDHAFIGSWILRTHGVNSRVTTAVGRHHSSDARAAAGIVRTADMLAHHFASGAVGHDRLWEASRALGLSKRMHEELLYELPASCDARVPRVEAPPLTKRQLETLRGLADGKLYKQIAREMGVGESTVRTHLHVLYKKIGVADRAQAVLLAQRSGWL